MNTELAEIAHQEIAPAGHFKLLEITNPFEPHKHEDSFVPWSEGLTVAQALAGRLDPETSVVCLNGGVVSPESWETTLVPDQSCLAICEMPQGGGDAKDILRLVLVVAIIATGQYYLGAALTAGTIGAGTFIAGTVAVAAGAAILVNALIPPVMPDMEDQSDSSSYGIDGAKNTSREGVKVPVCYGKFRMAGNIISLHVRNAGNTQYLYGLYNAGEGQVAGITDPEINDQPIANFSNVEIDTRLGTPTQQPIDWFESSVSAVSRGVTIGTGWSTYTGLNVIDRFRLDFVAPTGIWRVDDKGRKKTVTVTLEAEYRLVGGSTWTTLVPGTEPLSYAPSYNYFGFNNYDPSGSSTGYTGDESLPSLTSGDTVSNGTIFRGGVPVGFVGTEAFYGGALSVTSDQTSPYRWSVYSPTLTQGTYEVRVRRTNAQTETDKQRDSVVWSDYNEIVNDKVAYRNTALLALKIKLTDQLSSLPNVTYINHGRVIKYWSGSAWKDGPSSNPAWIAYDMITNGRFGADVDPSRIDIDRWKEWGDYCDDVNLTFNGVLDVGQTFWDALQIVLRAGHARLVRVGTRYSVAIEMPTSPSMMFTSGNIIKGSFGQQWTGVESRANEVEVSYFDKEDHYKRHTIKVYDAAVDPNTRQNTASLTLIGVVDADRATKEAIFQLKMNRYIRSLCSFEAPLEAIACTVGDTVLVQHDQPNWSVGGRLESGSTTTNIKLDRPVTLAAGTTYKLLVHFGALVRLTGTVSAIAGNTISLSGYTGQTNIHRLVVAGKDYQVTGFHANGVYIDEAPTFSVGATYNAYETDVIETRTVSSAAGTHTQVTVTAGFPVAPAQFANFMIGENAQVTKAWRINGIEMGSSDMTRKLNCFEYAPEIYDWTGTAVQPDDSYSNVVPHVTNLAISELSVPDGTSIVSELTASWTTPVDFTEYDAVDLYKSTDGVPFEYLATVKAPQTSYSFSADPGVTVQLKAQARSIDGRFAPFSSVPLVSRLVAGDTVAPAVPTSVTLSVGQIGLAVGFVRPNDLDYVGSRIFRNTTNNSGTATHVFTTDATQQVYNDLQANDPSQDYYYWVRSADNSGNLSAFVPTTPAFAKPTGILVNGYLTNESVVLSAANDGTVSSFAPATGTFKVFEGATDVTAQTAFSEVSETGCTGTINASTGVYSVTAMSSNTASYVVRATYKGVVIDKVFSLSKAVAGTAGPPGSGAPGISSSLSPSAVSLFAYADGSIPSYAAANGRFRLYEGANDVTASATLTATPGSGVTGTVNTADNTPVNGQPKGYFRVTELTADSGLLTISATYSGQTFTAVFSVSRVKTGYEIVAVLPTTNLFEGRVVYLTTDDKLYRYTGSAWTTAVPAVDISGQIADSQISAVGASKVTGQLVNSQIADLAASKITGQLTNSQIADLAAAKVSGQLTDAQIQAIAAAKVTGTLVDSQLAGISASKMTGQLTNSQIADLAATKISGQLSDSQLAAIAAAKVTGQLVDAQIAAVGAAKITGQLTASQLNIGIGGGNLLRNSGFEVGGGSPSGVAGDWLAFNGGAGDAGRVVSTSLDPGMPGLIGSLCQFVQIVSATNSTDTGILATQSSPVIAGQTYTGSAYINPNVGGKLAVLLRFADAGGNGLGDFYSATATANTWARYVVSAVAPANSTQVYFMVRGITAASESFRVDGAQLEQATLPSTYAPRPDEILAGAVGTTQIADNAVTTAKLVAESVVAGKIAAGAVETTKLAASAVTADKLAANSVTAGKVAAKAITTEKLLVSGMGASLWGDTCFQDPSAWVVSNWHDLPIQAAVSDGIAGGTTMRTPTGTGSSARGARRVPVTVGKTYRISLYARRSSDANGFLYLRIDGSTAESGSYEERGYWIEGVYPGTAWTRYTATVVAAQPFWSPMVLLNYAATAGWMEAQDIRIEEVIPGELIVDGAIIASKIAANAVTADKIAANAVTATQISAGAVTTQKIAAGAVTANEIAANAVTAAKVAAQAITAEKLLVAAPGSALNADPAMADPSAWANYSGAATFINGVTDGKVGVTSARNPSGGVQAWMNDAKSVPLDPAKTYRVRAWARTVSGSGSTIYIGLALFDNSGNNISGDGAQWSYATASGPQPSGSWTEYSADYGAGTARPFPSNARYMRTLFIIGYGGGNSVHEIQDLRLEEVLPATLIQNGAVTTDKLAANSVVAAKIAAGAVVAGKIAADAVTANEIAANAITAPKISAGAVTTQKIAAQAVTANEIAARTITAERLALGALDNLAPNGNFATGNFSDWRPWYNGNEVLARGAAGVPAGAPANFVCRMYSLAGANDSTIFNCGKVYSDTDAWKYGIQCRPGEQYRFALDAASTVSGYAGILFYVYYAKTDGTYNNATLVGTYTVSGSWATFSPPMFEVPADAVAFWPYIYVQSTFGGGGSVYFTNLRVIRAASAELIVDGAVIASKIAAGAVVADKIAANAVTTGKLLVTGVGASIVDDPNTQDLSAWTSGSTITIVNDTSSPTGKALEVSSVGQTTYSERMVPIDATKNYLATIWARQVSGSPGSYFLIAFYDAAGSLLIGGNYPTGWYSAGSFHYWGRANELIPSVWTEYRYAFGPGETAKIPPGAAFLRIGVLANYSGAGVSRFTRLSVVEKTGADLIVDGSVIAQKVAAGAITADKMAANSVTANAIAAGSVTAAKMAVSTLDAISANVGTLTAGVIRNAADTYRTDVTNGRTIVQIGSLMKVTGAPFGSSSQFIEWFGPYQSNLANCTESNATAYLKTNGAAYFGGSLSAGTLTNRGETSDLSTSAQIIVGPFGTNGDPKLVTVSYSYSGTWTEFQNQSSGSSSGTISATVRLYRKIGAGSETEVATLNVSGNWSYYTDGEQQPGGIYYRYWEQAMSGSVTYTDSDSSMGDRTYRATVTARSTAFGTGSNSQRVSIVSTEE
jgi:predicted phage tail protein